MLKNHLFQTLPIGALFFRDPFNKSENPSIKINDTQARTPGGCVSDVNGGVMVFTHRPAFITYIPHPEDQEILYPSVLEVG